MKKNYYTNTMDCLNKYNEICHKIACSPDETTEEEDEYLQNFALYLAHSLIKDFGFGPVSRNELIKVADIIKAYGVE